MISSPSFMEIHDSLLGTVHPVILYSGDESYPYYGVGTAFTVQWSKNIYLISAKHVWVNQGSRPENIRIFLQAGMELRFDREAVMKDDYSPAGDLLVLRVYQEDIEALSKNGLYWMDIEQAIGDDVEGVERNYFICGYPGTGRSYDYDESLFSGTMGILFGKGICSQVPGLESLRLEQSGAVELRGYSGSPVIRYANGRMEFSGMVVAGSDTSGVVNYIPAQAVAELLCDVEGLEYRQNYLASD